MDSDEAIEEVWLQEDIDTDEFWKQPEILQDMCNILRGSIASSSSYDNELLELPSRPAQKPGRRLFGKKVAPSPSPTKPPEIKVDVEQEDICYRVENAFGLFETQSRPAIVVRVNTRG